MKTDGPNKEATLIILRELKTKETLFTKQEAKSAEMQYKWLKKMQSMREDAKALYEKNGRNELYLKECNELSVINQLIETLEADMPKQLTTEEIKAIITDGKAKGWAIRDVMTFFKENHPTTDKSIIARIAKEIL
jgi:uncharacterized protein YqeY